MHLLLLSRFRQASQAGQSLILICIWTLLRGSYAKSADHVSTLLFSFADLIWVSCTVYFISSFIAERNIQEVPFSSSPFYTTMLTISAGTLSTDLDNLKRAIHLLLPLGGETAPIQETRAAPPTRGPRAMLSLNQADAEGIGVESTHSI